MSARTGKILLLSATGFAVVIVVLTLSVVSFVLDKPVQWDEWAMSIGTAIVVGAFLALLLASRWTDEEDEEPPEAQSGSAFQVEGRRRVEPGKGVQVREPQERPPRERR